MAVHRYFCEHFEPGSCRLSPEESHHAASVMRVRPGEAVELFDGCGGTASATVTRVAREAVTVEVTRLRPMAVRPEPSLALYVAVPKGARQHVLVEKCTELGVSRIEPIITQRSVVKPGASIVSRWRRYAIEAGKQSEQAWLPVIEPPLAFARSIELDRADELQRSTSLRLVASPGPKARPLTLSLREGIASGALSRVAIWIGPEGGFTPAEVEAAEAAGIQPVSLGESVLRIETAAIAVTAAVRLLVV